MVVIHFAFIVDLYPEDDVSECDLRYFYQDAGQWRPLSLIIGSFLMEYLSMRLEDDMWAAFVSSIALVSISSSAFGAVWEKMVKACLLNAFSLGVRLPLVERDSFERVPHYATAYFHGNTLKFPEDSKSNCFYWGVSDTLPIVEGFLLTETRVIGIQVTTGCVRDKLKAILGKSASKESFWESIRTFLEEEAKAGRKRYFSLFLLVVPDALKQYRDRYRDEYIRVKKSVVFVDTTETHEMLESIYSARKEYLEKRERF